MDAQSAATIYRAASYLVPAAITLAAAALAWLRQSRVKLAGRVKSSRDGELGQWQ